MSSYGGQKGPAWVLLRKHLVRALWRQSDHAKIDNNFILRKIFQKKVEKGQRLVGQFENPKIGQQLADQLDESEKSHQAGDQLEMPEIFGLVPWKHHVLIISKCKTLDEAIFCINKVTEESWSRS